ncbi:MAG: poly-gamma-glutamate synthase PgsB [Bacteroidota bacterium]
MIVTLVLVILVMVLLIGESIIINQSAMNINTKIHVNGTRGKSTVVKYIKAGLSNADLKVMGKVTGEIPTILLPDDTTETINRKGPARVQEQFNVIRKAKKSNADALVLECMSIDPALQKLESKFYKPDIYIITNIRDDHQEKMGSTLESHVESICSAIPGNSKIIACESPYMDVIRNKAVAQNSEFIQAISLNVPEKEKIPETAHEANIKIALTACVEAGIKRDVAFKGILKIIAKSKSPLVSFLNNKEEQFFLNAFSVNDPQSATDFLGSWMKKLFITDKIVVIFNTRSDRPTRTGLFAEWIKSNQQDIAMVILTGDHKIRANRLLSSMKINPKVKSLRFNSSTSIKKTIMENVGVSRLIVGVGNIKGLGYQIINEFSKAS